MDAPLTPPTPALQFWATKKETDLAKEVHLKVKRYFDACNEMGLIEKYRMQYGIHFMRLDGKDRTMLDLGTKKKTEIRIHIPEVRSMIRQQLAFVLAEPVSFQCVASNGDTENVMASEVGDKAVNYCYDEYIRPSIPELAETALVYGMAASHLRWDRAQGDDIVETIEVPAPPPAPPGKTALAKQPGKSGAPYVDICDPTMFAFDPSIGLKAGWVVAFERTNVFVLAAKFPEKAQAILAQGNIRGIDQYEEFRLRQWTSALGGNEGDCTVMHFYYADRPELPKGRYALILNELVIDDIAECPLPAGRLPIRPIITAKFTDCALSFADGWGLTAIEDALNRVRSSELTNYAYFGNQTRVREEGSKVVKGEALSNGGKNQREIVVPRGGTPPSMMTIQPMPSTEPLKQDLIQALPRVSGFGDISRGMVENTTSGAHAEVFEAITARNLSLPTATLVAHEQALANDMLDMMQRYGNSEFIIEIAGKSGATLAKSFAPSAFSSFRRVVAKAIPDAMRGSLARIKLVELTKDMPDAREKAKAIQMILRGDDEYGRNDARVENLIAIENERLSVGDVPVRAYPSQNHYAHIIDHEFAFEELLTQPVPDEMAIQRYDAHIQEHRNLLMNQDPIIAKAMGYPDPPMLPGNPMFMFTQASNQAQMMAQPPPPTPIEPDQDEAQKGPTNA